VIGYENCALDAGLDDANAGQVTKSLAVWETQFFAAKLAKQQQDLNP
jgi:hypothetical protein